MRRWLILGLCVVTVWAWADFSYSKTTGWVSSDGSVEAQLKKGLENPDALRLMNEAASAALQKKVEKARRTYRSVAHKYPASAWAPQAVFEMAEIRRADGKIAQAFELYGQIVSDYPSYPAFDDILKKMFDLAEQMRDQKTANFLGWRYKDRQAAIDAFEKIVVAAPYSDYAPRALATIGRLYTEKHEGLSAVDAYQRLIAGYPNHPLVPDAYWNMAQAYRGMVAGAPYDQGATLKAVHTYEEFLALFPDEPRASEAKGYLIQMKDTLALGKYNLAIYYLDKRHNREAAITLLKDVLQVAPESPTAIEAQKLLQKLAANPEVTSAKPVKKAQAKTAKTPTYKKILHKMLFWEK